MTREELWLDMGRHFTPDQLAGDLASLVDDHFEGNYSGSLEVLDLFAGDGRLGHATSERLTSRGFKTKVTYAEVREGVQGLSGDDAWLVANAFNLELDVLFDLVVCNPPYRRLSRLAAQELGLPWDRLKAAAHNLYCLGILKALQLCRPGGMVAVIAPFGWIRSTHAQSFRKQLAGFCAEAVVHPQASRRLFDGVSQDIALQIFKRGSGSEEALLRVNDSIIPIDSGRCENSGSTLPGPRVRVGPLVWNRVKEFLCAEEGDTYPVVYGGSIKGGRLDLRSGRYVARQYVKKSVVPAGFISRGCCILLRRTLRGCPGSWTIDATITDSDFCAVAENHVIVIEVESCGISARMLCERVLVELTSHCLLLGNPIISTSAVKAATGVAFADLTGGD